MTGTWTPTSPIAPLQARMQEAYERCGFMGERVLGFAYKASAAQTAAALSVSSIALCAKGLCELAQEEGVGVGVLA